MEHTRRPAQATAWRASSRLARGDLHGDIGQALVDRKLGRLLAVSLAGMENPASSRGASADQRERTRAAALAAAGAARAEDRRSLAVGPCPARAGGAA